MPNDLRKDEVLEAASFPGRHGEGEGVLDRWKLEEVSAKNQLDSAERFVVVPYLSCYLFKLRKKASGEHADLIKDENLNF